MICSAALVYADKIYEWNVWNGATTIGHTVVNRIPVKWTELFQIRNVTPFFSLERPKRRDDIASISLGNRFSNYSRYGVRTSEEHVASTRYLEREWKVIILLATSIRPWQATMTPRRACNVPTDSFSFFLVDFEQLPWLAIISHPQALESFYYAHIA